MHPGEITTEINYKKMFIPLGGWLFVEKDTVEEKMSSGLYRPLSSMGQKLKYCMTGKIISKSPFPPNETEWHREYWEILKIGDKVGFNGTVPMLSPMPPHIEEQIKNDGRFICFHIADVLGVICETEIEQIEFMSRLFPT